MGIYSYTQNGINFNNLNSSPSPIKKIPGKLMHNNNDYEYASDGIDMAIDAITIDWNGAEMGENKTLNTTGEVLSRYKVAI